jgi:hypothetical protein
MKLRRSILLHGLRLVITRPGAILWTYALNLGIAILFSLRLHAQLASILDHSLAAERLNSAFDLGTLQSVLHRLDYMAPSTGLTTYAGLPLYLLGYFLLVPGTLFCYEAAAPARLSILLSSGISYFWRFVRITLLTLIVSAAILVPLALLQSNYAASVDETIVGESALLRELPGILLIFLVAALLRLYFDLVEVYTVQLGDHHLRDGSPDRRVRRALLPALRTLRQNFARAYLCFVALTILGFAAFAAPAWIALHMLAQPQVWLTFLITQAGLLAMLATRFWQRGAETILALDYPLPIPSETTLESEPEPHHFPTDAQPDPEPAPPSLPEPDPAVFHHEPTPPEPVADEPWQPPPGEATPQATLEPTPEPKGPVPWWQE